MNKIKALLLLLIALLQYRLWFGDGNVLEFQRLNDRIAELQQEGAKRRERNAALEAEVVDLKQGLDAVEERARHELGMIKEGEVFVQVIEPSHESDAHPATPSEQTAGEKPVAEKKAKGGGSGTPKSKASATPPSTESTAASRPEKPKTAPKEKPRAQGNAPAKAPAKPKPSSKPPAVKPKVPDAAQVAPQEDTDQ